MTRSRFPLLLCSLLCLATLAGCGQKDKLYLPDQPPQAALAQAG